MDIKTLEYMEERSKKGREIVERIEQFKKRIGQVKSKSFQCIDLKIGSDTLRIGKWGSEPTDNNYGTEAVARMLNIFIDVTNAEIQRLEQELAEL